MELQLALAPPSPPFVFDLNSCCHNEDSVSDSDSASSTVTRDGYRKRSFDDAFDFDDHVKAVPPRTLPLFVSWNKQPHGGDDDDQYHNQSFFSSNKTSNEDGVVGWPPINNWRLKLCNQQYHGGRGGGGRGIENNQTVMGNGSTYVKVKMEGVAIARKIDPSLYNSFHSLTNTLITMFSFWHEDDACNYKLSYQDRDGDWLIAQDVPWRTFIRTVRRLRLSKSSC